MVRNSEYSPPYNFSCKLCEQKFIFNSDNVNCNHMYFHRKYTTHELICRHCIRKKHLSRDDKPHNSTEDPYPPIKPHISTVK